MLNGDASLNVGHLMQPFHSLTNHAYMAQLALQQNGNMPQIPQQALEAGGEELNGNKTQKRARRAYKARDPNAPKRPLTAYFRYLGEQRAQIAQEFKDNPELAANGSKPGDISKIATERWNALSHEQQQPYRDAYQQALQEHTAAMAKYKGETGNPEDVDATDVTMNEDEDAEADAEVGAKRAKTEAVETSEVEDDSTSSEDTSSSEDEEEDEPAPPPPPPAAKTPKSAMKRKKASDATPAPAPTFNSINPKKEVPSSSPERKRKTSSTENEVETGKSKKSKKSAIARETEAQASSPAPVASSKKSKKDKKEKTSMV